MDENPEQRDDEGTDQHFEVALVIYEVVLRSAWRYEHDELDSRRLIELVVGYLQVYVSQLADGRGEAAGA